MTTRQHRRRPADSTPTGVAVVRSVAWHRSKRISSGTRPPAGRSVFDGVPPEQIELALDELPRRRYPAGSTVIAEGDTADELYVVEAGVADVFVADSDGAEHRVGSVHAGGTLGEMSLFTGQPAAGTVRAPSDLEVLVVHAPEFERIAGEFPVVYRNLGAILSERLARTNGSPRARARPGRRASATGRAAAARLRRSPPASPGTPAAGGAARRRRRRPRGGGARLAARRRSPAPAHRPAQPAPHVRDAARRGRARPRTVHQLSGLRLRVDPRPPRGDAAGAVTATRRSLDLGAATRASVALLRRRPRRPAGRPAAELDRRRRPSAASRALLCGLSVGIALGAGSVRGYAHWGVLRAFDKLGLQRRLHRRHERRRLRRGAPRGWARRTRRGSTRSSARASPRSATLPGRGCSRTARSAGSCTARSGRFGSRTCRGRSGSSRRTSSSSGGRVPTRPGLAGGAGEHLDPGRLPGAADRGAPRRRRRRRQPGPDSVAAEMGAGVVSASSSSGGDSAHRRRGRRREGHAALGGRRDHARDRHDAGPHRLGGRGGARDRDRARLRAPPSEEAARPSPTARATSSGLEAAEAGAAAHRGGAPVAAAVTATRPSPTAPPRSTRRRARALTARSRRTGDAARHPRLPARDPEPRRLVRRDRRGARAARLLRCTCPTGAARASARAARRLRAARAARRRRAASSSSLGASRTARPRSCVGGCWGARPALAYALEARTSWPGSRSSGLR